MFGKATIEEAAQLQAKLDAAMRRIADLEMELKRQDVQHRQALQAQQAETQQWKAAVEGAKLSVQRAREDARNAKERAKRLKRKILKLEQQQ